MTKTAKPTETAKAVMVACRPCISEDKRQEGKVLSRTAKPVNTAKTVMKAAPFKLSPLFRHPGIKRENLHLNYLKFPMQWF